jgi:purine-nucleoside phosphorylase
MAKYALPDYLHLEEIYTVIKGQLPSHFSPEIGIICGSGLSGLGNAISNPISISYSSIPHFLESTVAGHGQQLIFGTIHHHPIVAATGRFHLYEGHDIRRLSLLPRIFAALGCKILIVTNAAGGLNTTYNVGDIMLIKDHISMAGLAGIHPLVGKNDDRFGPRFPPVTNVYNSSLQQLFISVAEDLSLTKHIHQGVYMGVSGPSYETKSEVGMLRNLGGDVVGMSTVPEVLAAAHAGMQVLGISLVTNKCIAPGDIVTPPPSHEEVLTSTAARAHDIVKLIMGTIALMDPSVFPETKASVYFKSAASFKQRLRTHYHSQIDLRNQKLMKKYSSKYLPDFLVNLIQKGIDRLYQHPVSVTLLAASVTSSIVSLYYISRLRTKFI